MVVSLGFLTGFKGLFGCRNESREAIDKLGGGCEDGEIGGRLEGWIELDWMGG